MNQNNMSNTDKKNNRINVSTNAYSMILGFLGCIGCAGIMANENTISFSNSIFAFLLWGLSSYVLKGVLPKFLEASKSQRVYAYAFSVVLSVALHMGTQLELHENVDFTSIKLYVGSLCLALFLAPIINGLWNAFFEHNLTKKKDEKPLRLISVWFVIFALWIPTFLALYPGAFVYDATDEYIEVISRGFSMHHPLIHVLLLGGMVHLGEYLGLGANIGIAVYTLLQMLIFSWTLAYVIVKLQSFGVGKRVLLGIIVVLGVFPIFPMYAVCSAKDTLFTSAFILITVLLIQFVREDKSFFDKRTILFVVASVAMMLLRNNGAYAYIVAIPFTALCLLSGIDKKSWAKLAILMLLSVVLYKGSEYCLKLATHASDSEHQEMLTVPIQQLARVYKYSPESFDAEDRASLYNILPENYLITYTPRCSDVLKSGFDNIQYAKHKGRYIKLWFKIGMKKPLIYLNAWLVNCYGYWYPDAINNVYGGNQMYTFQYRDSSYFGFETEPPGVRHSLFPLLEKLYRNISLEIFQQKVPVISMLFAPGFVFWLFAWVFVGLMRQKLWGYLIAYVPILLLIGTVLLGPTVLVRYALILWCVLPIMFSYRGVAIDK